MMTTEGNATRRHLHGRGDGHWLRGVSRRERSGLWRLPPRTVRTRMSSMCWNLPGGCNLGSPACWQGTRLQRVRSPRRLNPPRQSRASGRAAARRAARPLGADRHALPGQAARLASFTADGPKAVGAQRAEPPAALALWRRAFGPRGACHAPEGLRGTGASGPGAEGGGRCRRALEAAFAQAVRGD